MRGFDHRITTCAPAPVPPHVAAAQVRDIQTNVTYIRETIVSIKPDDVTLDLSPLYDAERQAADAVDVVEVWSGDARDILQGLKASFVIFGVCAIALALFGIAVLWRRVRPAVTPHISTHHTAVQPCLGQSCACRSVLLWRHTPTTPAAPQTTTFGAVQTRSLLYLFFALAGAWTFIAWLLGTLGVTVRTFFRDLCDVLLLHVNGEQNAWILDTLRCRELRRGIRGLGTAMAAANAKIEDVNADIESAPLAWGPQTVPRPRTRAPSRTSPVSCSCGTHNKTASGAGLRWHARAALCPTRHRAGCPCVAQHRRGRVRACRPCVGRTRTARCREVHKTNGVSVKGVDT